MDEFAYTTKIKDSMNFVYPSKTEQKANFVTKLDEIMGVWANESGIWRPQNRMEKSLIIEKIKSIKDNAILIIPVEALTC